MIFLNQDQASSLDNVAIEHLKSLYVIDFCCVAEKEKLMKLLNAIFGRWFHIPGVKVATELIFVILPLAFAIRTFVFGLYQVPSGSMETTLLQGERFVADKFSYWVRLPKRSEIIAFNAPDKSVFEKGFSYSQNPLINWFERYVWGPDNWTKRVIGLPGDHVKGVIEDGRPAIYLNGKKLDESSYINKYPLIGVWKEVSHGRESNLKSFDPTLSWDQQPFYKINPNSIIIDPKADEPYTILPGTALPDGKDEFEVKLGANQYWVMGDNRLGSSDSRMWGPLDSKLIHGKIVFRLWSMDSGESWFLLDLLKHPINFWKKIRWTRCLQFV